jgi:hypothetical protein
MSRTKRLGLAAYKALIEAAPVSLVDGLDNRLAAAKVQRLTTRELKQIDLWARTVRTPSKWYATDGSGCFYYFRNRRTTFLSGWHSFARLPMTVFGDDAAQAYMRHGGQLTDRRPSGWVSAATLAGVRYGGLEGGPRDWGWRDNEDIDFDVRQCEQLRAKDPSFRPVGPYSEHLSRAMAGAR